MPISPKHLYLPTNPHGVTIQKNNTVIFTAVRTSNLTGMQMCKECISKYRLFHFPRMWLLCDIFSRSRLSHGGWLACDTKHQFNRITLLLVHPFTMSNKMVTSRATASWLQRERRKALPGDIWQVR
jgi:hypothetical protein